MNGVFLPVKINRVDLKKEKSIFLWLREVLHNRQNTQCLRSCQATQLSGKKNYLLLLFLSQDLEILDFLGKIKPVQNVLQLYGDGCMVFSCLLQLQRLSGHSTLCAFLLPCPSALSDKFSL